MKVDYIPPATVTITAKNKKDEEAARLLQEVLNYEIERRHREAWERYFGKDWLTQ